MYYSFVTLIERKDSILCHESTVIIATRKDNNHSFKMSQNRKIKGNLNLWKRTNM